MFFFFFAEDPDTSVPVEMDEKDVDPGDLEFFLDDTIRKVWDPTIEEFYFSVVDVCGYLTDSNDPRKYWNKLKERLSAEGSQLVTFCHQLKLKSPGDGKMYKTDCATTEQLLRIIQSIPSKKAEPFKLWLAKVGAERLEEIADPEKAIDRALSYYRQKGYSEEWITQRMQSKEIRKKLTDEWKRVGIEDSKDYAALTNIFTHAWSDKTVTEYKKFKGLHKENLRDNMTDLELTLNQLAEVSTAALSKTKNPSGLSESKQIAHDGGAIAGNARRELEEKLGHSVVSPLNASNPAALDVRDS